jgi:hypothetical protein
MTNVYLKSAFVLVSLAALTAIAQQNGTPGQNQQSQQPQQQKPANEQDNYPDPWEADSGNGAFKLTDGTNPFADWKPDPNNGQMPAQDPQAQQPQQPQSPPEPPKKSCGEISAKGQGFTVIFVFRNGKLTDPAFRIEREAVSTDLVTAAEVSKINEFHGASFFPDQPTVDVPIYFEPQGSSCSSNFRLDPPSLKGVLTLDDKDLFNPHYIVPAK